jgi:hypothetical protein
VERREAVACDGGGEDLARFPGAVRLDDPAERVGPLELGVDLDGLRCQRRGAEEQDRNQA